MSRSTPDTREYERSRQALAFISLYQIVSRSLEILTARFGRNNRDNGLVGSHWPGLLSVSILELTDTGCLAWLLHEGGAHN